MNNNFLKKAFLSEQYKKDIEMCVDYIKNNDLSTIEPGKYAIDGERVFVGIAYYNTDTPENRIWEAHAKYNDLHYMIDGCEELWIDDISNTKVISHDENRDFITLEAGSYKEAVILKNGDFCICLPHEAHKTGVAVGESIKVKKAVFKFLV